eukprot:1040936_1
MASSFCTICSVKFESTISLLSHINIHIGRKCKHCNKLFTASLSQNPLQTYNDKCKDSHLWISQQSALKPSEPSPPPSSLLSNTTTKRHTANPNPPPPTLQCKHCSYCTHCNTRFKKHMRCHTNERPYKCDECGKAFTVKCNLINHIRSVHRKERSFKCRFCGNGFIRSDRLKEHERIHTGEKPLKCEFCSARFATSSRLNKHKKKHTGYKCRFCDDTFKTEYQLKQHKKAEHSSILNKKASNYIIGKRWFPFGCKYCGLRFLEKELLQAHRTLHDGLICDKCDTLFATKILLMEHKGTCKGIKVVKEVINDTPNKTKRPKKVYAKQGVENKNHHCFQCDRYFPSGQSLGGHRASAHRANRKKRAKTNVNGKKKRKRKSTKAKKTKEDVMNGCGLGLDIKYKNEEELLCDKSLKTKSDETVVKTSLYRTRSKKKAIEIATKDCPGRHGLILTMTADNRVFECAECNKTMYLNEEMYRCKWCDYDLCMTCFKGESNGLNECKTMGDDSVQIEKESECKSIPNVSNKKRKRADVALDSSLGAKPPTKKRKRLIIRIPRVKRKKK